MCWLVWTSKVLGGRPPLASHCISLTWLFFHGGNTGSIFWRHIENPRNSAASRHWPLGQRCGFDKGSISVSEGVLAAQEAIRALCCQLVTDPEFLSRQHAGLYFPAGRNSSWFDGNRHS